MANPLMNESAPPANSRRTYEDELSLHIKIVPEGIKDIQVDKLIKFCNSRMKILYKI